MRRHHLEGAAFGELFADKDDVLAAESDVAALTTQLESTMIPKHLRDELVKPQRSEHSGRSRVDLHHLAALRLDDRASVPEPELYGDVASQRLLTALPSLVEVGVL